MLTVGNSEQGGHSHFWFPMWGSEIKCLRWGDSYQGDHSHLLTIDHLSSSDPPIIFISKSYLLSLTTDPSPYLLGLLPFYNEGHNQPFFWLHPNNYLKFNFPTKCNCPTTLVTSTVWVFLLLTHNVRLADREESAVWRLDIMARAIFLAVFEP